MSLLYMENYKTRKKTVSGKIKVYLKKCCSEQNLYGLGCLHGLEQAGPLRCSASLTFSIPHLPFQRAALAPSVL